MAAATGHALGEIQEVARRLRAEARRLADVRADLARATRERVWRGPASERFERGVDRRLTELDLQAAALDCLADRLHLAGGVR
jgi:uncharacterized protein YukE